MENFTTNKKEKIQTKNTDIFHISAQNIYCEYSLEPPRRGGSNEYPKFMFLSRNKKNNVYPCKPQFYYIKGLRGSKLYRYVFVTIVSFFLFVIYCHTLSRASWVETSSCFLCTKQCVLCVLLKDTSGKYAYIILTPLNPTFI